jgi:hypothetical protein
MGDTEIVGAQRFIQSLPLTLSEHDPGVPSLEVRTGCVGGKKLSRYMLIPLQKWVPSFFHFTHYIICGFIGPLGNHIHHGSSNYLLRQGGREFGFLG